MCQNVTSDPMDVSERDTRSNHHARSGDDGPSSPNDFPFLNYDRSGFSTMDGINEENITFVQFPDAASRERHHDHRNTKFCYERGFHMLGLAKRAPAFHARMMEFGLGPLTEAPPTARFGWASTSESKRRKTDGASSNKAVVEENDEGGEDENADDTLPTESQPPLYGSRVEEDMAAIRRRLGSSYASASTPVPPSTSFEIEMLRRQLRQERKKGLERDRLLGRMWKAMKVIFSCVAPRE
uniref:Uncharacterized protein n=1 Tax=Solanum tuberosum TaxID=4113 RepID=M1DRN2_SOLTU